MVDEEIIEATEGFTFPINAFFEFLIVAAEKQGTHCYGCDRRPRVFGCWTGRTGKIRSFCLDCILEEVGDVSEVTVTEIAAPEWKRICAKKGIKLG